MAKKSVTFDSNTVYITYSADEYDRSKIDCILYKKCLNKISNQEWNDVLKNLDKYKKNEMIVHKSSIYNTDFTNVFKHS